jgi:hypothetical protein
MSEAYGDSGLAYSKNGTVREPLKANARDQGLS